MEKSHIYRMKSPCDNSIGMYNLPIQIQYCSEFNDMPDSFAIVQIYKLTIKLKLKYTRICGNWQGYVISETWGGTGTKEELYRVCCIYLPHKYE